MRWHASLQKSALGFVALVASLGMAFLVGRANAGGIPESPNLMYSGVLEDASGKPLTGEYNIEVQLWRANRAVTEHVCTTGSQPHTLRSDGRFSTELPARCSAELRMHNDIEVEVSVNGRPFERTALGVLPYALEAEHASKADAATTAREAEQCATARTAEHALSADTAMHAETAANALTSIVSADLLASDSFGDICFPNLGGGECDVAAERKCRALGYVSGWFVGEWGSTGNGDSRSITCIK